MKAGRIFFLLSAVLFLTFFFYIPVFSVLKNAFIDQDGTLSLANIRNIFLSSYNRRIILFTIEQAALSTIFSLIIGFPGAYLLAGKEFPGKSVLKAIATVPFVLPSILVVLGFVLFFGNNGYLNRLLERMFHLNNPPLRILYSMKAIILAHGFYNFPIAMRIIASLWEKLSTNQLHASHSLGAGKIRTFFSVTLPQLLPAILSASALIFLFCFSSFAIILVLGGGPSYTTIEVEIYRQAKVSFNPQAASSLAAVGMFFSFSLMYITVHFQSKTSEKEDFILPAVQQRKEFKRTKSINIFILLYVIFILLLVAAPIISVIIKSFLSPSSRAGGDFFSLRWYQSLFIPQSGSHAFPATVAIRNSLRFAFTTAILSVLLGTVLSYSLVKKWIPGTFLIGMLDTLFMLPMIVSSVILGLGYILLHNKIPSGVADSGFLIIFAHTVIAYPFVIRSVTGVLRKIKPSILHAAVSLGAAPRYVFFSIELPLIKGAIMTGAAFAFAISIGELNATILLAGNNTVTIPLIIYRLIGSYNFYGACALGSILVILTTLSFIFMEKIGNSKGNAVLWD